MKSIIIINRKFTIVLLLLIDFFLVILNISIINSGILVPRTNCENFCANVTEPEVIPRWEERIGEELTISGTVFIDLNWDGLLEKRPHNIGVFEKGIGNVVIKVWSPVWNGKIDFSQEPDYIAVTNENGFYSIKIKPSFNVSSPKIDDRVYVIQEINPLGYISTSGDIINLHLTNSSRVVNFGDYPVSLDDKYENENI